MVAESSSGSLRALKAKITATQIKTLEYIAKQTLLSGWAFVCHGDATLRTVKNLLAKKLVEVRNGDLRCSHPMARITEKGRALLAASPKDPPCVFVPSTPSFATGKIAPCTMRTRM